MRRFVIAAIFLLLFFTFTIHLANAQSTYVLPYPSAMPGNILYKINLVKENLQKYWYFGDFAKVDYNLRYSDKYLVESITLFEYNQYLLAIDALDKSNDYFEKISPNLLVANKKGKNISEKSTILMNASKKHMEKLIKLKVELPREFLWEDEFSDPVLLEIHRDLNSAIKLRESI